MLIRYRLSFVQMLVLVPLLIFAVGGIIGRERRILSPCRF